MKKHGWVIECVAEGGEGFVDRNMGSRDGRDIPYPVEQAKVYATREQARGGDTKLEEDRIRKVELDANGKAVKVIPGR